jgi:ABC-type nickel/cobalt efflux system permease component RcnA
MEIASLVIELLLLALGLYLYLFARGAIRSKNPERQKRAESFRKNNARWMRILGLALAAVMLLNVIFHVSELLK